MTSAFDRGRQLTLVFGAGAGLAAWADFAIFGYEAAQKIGLFIVDYSIFVSTELANLRSGNIAPV